MAGWPAARDALRKVTLVAGQVVEAPGQQGFTCERCEAVRRMRKTIVGTA